MYGQMIREEKNEEEGLYQGFVGKDGEIMRKEVDNIRSFIPLLYLLIMFFSFGGRKALIS